MKLNKKVFFERVYLIVGTFIVLMVFSVVLVNFFKDSRLMAKATPVPTVPVPTQTAKPTVTPSSTPKSDGLYIYKRAEDLTPKPKVDYGESTPPPQNKEESALPPPEKIKVAVINLTQNLKLAEEVRATFEAAGFEVSAGNSSTLKPVKTEIIEHNEKKKGQEVKNILKAGVIRKELDPNSRFDVTVVLGDDFLP